MLNMWVKTSLLLVAGRMPPSAPFLTLVSTTIEDSESNTVLVAGTTVTFTPPARSCLEGLRMLVLRAPSPHGHPTFVAVLRKPLSTKAGQLQRPYGVSRRLASMRSSSTTLAHGAGSSEVGSP